MKKRIWRQFIFLVMAAALLCAALPGQRLTALAEADPAAAGGDPRYTVEFTYGGKQHVMAGGSAVPLSSILETVGLSGEVTAWEVSDSALFDVVPGTVPHLVSLAPFGTREWLRVTIGGVAYEIIVTDAQRVDENGDPAIPNVVMYLPASGTQLQSAQPITDPRVIQGPLDSNFTASMPLAEIYIDDTVVNQSLWHQYQLDGTKVKAELLVPNNDKYKAFVLNTTPGSTVTSLGNLKDSYGSLIYDFSKRKLRDTQILTVGTNESLKTNWELFEGPIVKYTIQGAASKFDTATNQYKNYDVVITYSDILLTLANNSDANDVDQNNLSNAYAQLMDTNVVDPSLKDGSTIIRLGMSYTVNVQVIDPATGTLLDGSYYYPMVDIDVGRTGIGNFSRLYNAGNLNNYSEQVALLGNYGRPTASGSWEQMVWIPGGNWSAAPTSNRNQITENNHPYTCKITSETVNGQAGTLLFQPGRDNGAVTGAINQNGVTSGKDNSFYSGFITLANNTAGGITVRGWGSAQGSGSMESYVLTGSQPVNHKLDASSDVGGTIYTTTTGNADGTLSGGALMGNSLVNTPHEISVATGQSVTYTMTPKGGYKLKAVYVKKEGIDIMTIVNTAKATINKNDYAGADGVLDENEQEQYDAAVSAAVSAKLNEDPNTFSVPLDSSDLPSLGHGIYTYTFRDVQEDNSIHVEWEKTELTVKKELNPPESGVTDTFDFEIALSDTSIRETNWRVRASKQIGTLSQVSHLTSLFDEPYYMTYFENHTERGDVEVFTPVNPASLGGTENPVEEGWYELIEGEYRLSADTAADSGKTYYSRSVTEGDVQKYFHHVIGYNEATGLWEDVVVESTADYSAPASGLFDLTEKGDNYLYITFNDQDRMGMVYSVASYEAESDTYTKYLMWVHDDTINENVLVIGNEQTHPTGIAFKRGDFNNSSHVYIYNDGIPNYSRKIIQSTDHPYTKLQDVYGKTYNRSWNSAQYTFEQTPGNMAYYDLLNNPNGYTLDSGYSRLEGETGMYVVTLPGGQRPNVSALENDGWSVSVSQVSRVNDDFDLDAAMRAAGAEPVPRKTNTYEFTLGANETIDFTGVIPMGWNYKITEVGMSNSEWELESISGKDAVSNYEGEEHVTFTNQRGASALIVKKTTERNAPGTFIFKLKLLRPRVVPRQEHVVTIQASISGGTPSYVFNNPGGAFEVNGITVPTGPFSNGGTQTGLDAVCDVLLGLAHTNEGTQIQLGGEIGALNTSETTSLQDQVQALLNNGYTSAYLEPIAYNFSAGGTTVDEEFLLPDPYPAGVTYDSAAGEYTFALANDSSLLFPTLPRKVKYEVWEVDGNGSKVAVGGGPAEDWRLLSATDTTGVIMDNAYNGVLLGVNEYVPANLRGGLLFKDGSGWKKEDGTAASLSALFPGLSKDHASDGREITFDSETGLWKYADDGSEAGGSPAYTVTYSPSLENGFLLYKATVSPATYTARDIILGTVFDQAEFRNEHYVDLTISKEVKGSLGSKDKFFKFTINLAGLDSGAVLTMDTGKLVLNPTQNTATRYDIGTIAGANRRDEVTPAAGAPETDETRGQQILANANGTATIFVYMQHDNAVTIKGLPYGASYSVTEFHEGYSPVLEIEGDSRTDDGTNDEAPIVPSSAGTGSVKARDSFIAADTALGFTNEYQAVIPTGLTTDSPGLILASLAAASLLLCLVLLPGKRRASSGRTAR